MQEPPFYDIMAQLIVAVLILAVTFIVATHVVRFWIEVLQACGAFFS